MGQKIEIESANVPGVGSVVCRVQVTKNASGGVVARVMLEARYVDGNRIVSDDEHRERIARHIRAM